MTTTIKTALTKTRSAFGKTIESGHKQMGLRRIRDGLTALKNGNEARANEMMVAANHHLTYAVAITERGF